MSIHYMFDNHTFLKLDHKSIDDAMDLVEQATKIEGGYGFVGVKYGPVTCPTCGHASLTRKEPKSIQWRKGEDWKPRVRALLESEKQQGIRNEW